MYRVAFPVVCSEPDTSSFLKGFLHSSIEQAISHRLAHVRVLNRPATIQIRDRPRDPPNLVVRTSAQPKLAHRPREQDPRRISQLRQSIQLLAAQQLRRRASWRRASWRRA